jgi:hypothetical protein
MEELRFGDQLVRFDREATAAAYSNLPSGDADRCKCVYCRNFVAQRATVYPQSFRAFLDRLGIDPKKEGEVYDMAGPFEDRIRPTGGWFYFVGELIEKGGETDSGRRFSILVPAVFSSPSSRVWQGGGRN